MVEVSERLLDPKREHEEEDEMMVNAFVAFVEDTVVLAFDSLTEDANFPR